MAGPLVTRVSEHAARTAEKFLRDMGEILSADVLATAKVYSNVHPSIVLDDDEMPDHDETWAPANLAKPWSHTLDVYFDPEKFDHDLSQYAECECHKQRPNRSDCDYMLVADHVEARISDAFDICGWAHNEVMLQRQDNGFINLDERLVQKGLVQ